MDLEDWDVEDKSMPMSTISRSPSTNTGFNTASTIRRVGAVALQGEWPMLEKKVPVQELIDMASDSGDNRRFVGLQFEETLMT